MEEPGNANGILFLVERNGVVWEFVDYDKGVLELTGIVDVLRIAIELRRLT